jgi:hypothetical protein
VPVDHRDELADRLVIARPREAADHPRLRVKRLAQLRAVAVAHAFDVEIDRARDLRFLRIRYGHRRSSHWVVWT